ncbi:uncharacterized protein FPRN_10871 [Fusarium proliferatum]|nr:uncharacterized protein FPRN_10871 [Fusarium proliferatum]
MSIEPQTISTLGTTAGLSVGNECRYAPLFAPSSKSGYSQLDLPQPTYENPPAESVKIYVTTIGEAKAGTDIDASLQEFSSLINQPTWSDPHSEWPHIEKLIRACIKCHDRKPSYRVESSFGGFLSTAATAAQGTGLDKLNRPETPNQVQHGICASDHSIDSHCCESEACAYVKAFEKHVLRMHPIIQPSLLHHWIRESLNQPPSLFISLPAYSVEPGTPTSEGGNKLNQESKLFPTGLARSCEPDTSISHALVLMVMALGKICARRDQAPDVLNLTEPLSYDSLVSHYGDISPSSSESCPINHPGCFCEQNGRAHQSSTGGFCCGLGFEERSEKTVGFQYFTYATNILRCHPDSTDINSVYAYIFAALYCSQLERPRDSLAFIQRASDLLQDIIQPFLETMRKFKQNDELIQDIEHNQLALVFWTCLMLQSDFKTESPSPGLLLYEDSMPHPNMRLLNGFSKRVCDGYLAQLSLRQHLNDVNKRLRTLNLSAYTRQEQLGDITEMANAVSGLHWALPHFAYGDDTCNDILAARLRAKYWGAQVIIYRPFVRQVLFSSGLGGNQAERIANIDPQIIQLARNGIHSLSESLQAFDGLEDRMFITTNISCLASA